MVRLKRLEDFPAYFMDYFTSLMLFCLIFRSAKSINSLQNSYFLLARQEVSLADLHKTSDPLVLPCRKLGVWPHPNSCSEYLICRKESGPNGLRIIIEHFRCAFGIYDTKSGRCNWAKLSAPCRSGNVTLILPDIIPVLSATTTRITSSSRDPSKSVEKRQQRPSSYISELSGLTCKAAGYFPHPVNNTKFFRCVALYPDTFMIYLFSCENTLVYEPTVRACVKSLGEERMDAGVDFPLVSETPTWIVERCRAMQLNPTGKPTSLFRNPYNCRRFFRCTSSSISMKIEQFSCPTGLFFDEERKTCTWASETSECLSAVDEAADGSQSPSTWVSNARVTPLPSNTFATVWVTMPRKVTRVSNPAGEERVKLLASTTVATPATTVPVEAETSTPSSQANRLPIEEDVISSNVDNWLFKQALKPPPYLTATGILVTEPTAFRCTSAGTFPTSSPCVFWKCEKYAWVKHFLLFRFTCPPHTVFNNGTCEFNSTAGCANAPDDPSEFHNVVTDSTMNFGNIIPTTLSPPRDKISGQRQKPLLCTRDGIFPLPFARDCSTRFMVCRRLAGPMHFFVSIHECPPSLIFSPVSNQCVDPLSENLPCIVSNFDISSNGLPQELEEYTTPLPDPADETAANCAAPGFFKVSCRRFRRCEWVSDVGSSSSGTWISYDFECGKNMIFDENVVACVQPHDPSACQDVTKAPPSLVTTVSPAFQNEATPELPDDLVLIESITQIPDEQVENFNDTSAQSVTPENPAGSQTAEVNPAPFLLDFSTASSRSTGASWTLPNFLNQGTSEGPAASVSSTRATTTTEQPMSISQPVSDGPDDSNMDAGFENSTSLDEKSMGVPSEGAPSSTEGTATTQRRYKSPVCYRSGYFLYPDDTKCQRFYRCLQLTPEPNSFVMLHYRCDDGFVFDPRYLACSTIATAPSCAQISADTVSVDGAEKLSMTDNSAGTDGSGSVSSLPVKILPQVWQMSANDTVNTGALICTTQRVYRLQTCGYYYSCIETETKGQFHLQEIYCETLYLDISSGQCTTPPANDPCNANSITRFSSIWAVRKPSTKPMEPARTTTTTTSSSTTTSTTTATAETTTTPATTPAPTTTSTTLTTPTPKSTTTRISRPTAMRRRPTTQVPAAIKISGTNAGNGSDHSKVDLSSSVFISPGRNGEYFSSSRSKVALGTYTPVARPVLQTTRFQSGVTPAASRIAGAVRPTGVNGLMQASDEVQSLSSYRDNFHKLYSQMNGLDGLPTSTWGPTTSPASLVLNFNSATGQPADYVKAGVSFQCRSEGYFRNSRDVSCSKFYLCVKVGPRQYNLFEFMCLPHNGIQWKYNQDVNACADPDHVRDC